MRSAQKGRGIPHEGGGYTFPLPSQLCTSHKIARPGTTISLLLTSSLLMSLTGCAHTPSAEQRAWKRICAEAPYRAGQTISSLAWQAMIDAKAIEGTSLQQINQRCAR